MRALLVCLLACCLCGIAYGVQSDTSNVLDTTGKGTYPGDGATEDPRVGGDTCANATVIASLPYTDTGATCGYVNNYDYACPYTGSTSADVVYRYTPASNTQVTVDLCSSAYDTKVYIYATTCSGTPIACNDDAGCGYSGYQSKLVNVNLTGGVTYYIVVDGYGGSCGSYTISVTAPPPCIVTCPGGALQEGEPQCYDNYVDNYNGGCNTTPNIFQTVYAQAGGCFDFCGKSGTYLYGGSQYRDTDWLRVIGTGGTVTASCTAEFSLQFILIYGTNCSSLQYVITTASPCVQANLSYAIALGADAWIWVGPSVFTGVPCDADYLLHVCGVQAAPPPYGACCFPDGTCQFVQQAQCPTGTWYSGVACDPNPCPQPYGACCFPDGSCIYMPQAQCPTGDWRPGVLCDPNPCPQPYGACCFPDGSCIYMPQAQCPTGDWRPGVLCDPNPCPQPYGACCFPDGSCVYVQQAGCSTGDWHMFALCDPNPCTQPYGACCYPDGSCTVTLQVDCGGQWIMFGNCDPNPCPQPYGACCFPDGSCAYVQQAQCPTGDWRMGVLCDPNPCPQPPPVGACCFVDGTCQVLTEADCLALQGAWQGAGTDCDPNDCPPPVPVERTTWGQIKRQYR